MNQRRVLANRAGLADMLYAGPPPGPVITPGEVAARVRD